MTATARPKATTSRGDAACFGLVLIYLLGSVPTLEHYLVNPDHSYQLTLGRQITLGAFPFVDLFSHYGPLVAFTSAAMFTIHDSVLPETILCALMYTLAITLLFRIVRVYSDTRGWTAILLASTAVVASLFLMGRFYKWYFWFFPMLVLALLCETHIDNRTDRERYLRLSLAGLVSGIAALYRLDLGAACIAAVLGSTVLVAIDRRAFRTGTAQASVVAGAFVIPLAAWHGALIRAGGRVQDYWTATFAGVSDVVSTRNLPLPAFDLNQPFSSESILCVALIGTVLAYLAAIVAGVRAVVRPEQTLTPAIATLSLAALMGAAVFPQALHRPDVGHFVTVVPPLLALAFAGCATLWAKATSKRQPTLQTVVALLAIVGIAIVIGIESDVHRDMESFGRDLPERYQLLTEGPDEYLRNAQNAERRREIRARQQAQLVQLVHHHTTGTQTILPYGIIPAAYFFERRVAGLFPRYVDGIYDSAEWVERDRAQFEANPPALIVVPAKTGQSNPGASMHDEYIDTNYRAAPNLHRPDVPHRIYVPRKPR